VPERAACALRPADLSLQRVHEVAVVCEPRQLIRIRDCEPLPYRNRHRRMGRRRSGGRLGTGWRSGFRVVRGM